MTRPPFVSWSDSIHTCSLTRLRRPRGDSRSQRLAWGLWMPSELEKSILLEEFESPRRGRFWSESWWDDKNRFVVGRAIFSPIKNGRLSKNDALLLIFGRKISNLTHIFWDGLKPPTSAYITYYLHMCTIFITHCSSYIICMIVKRYEHLLTNIHTL